MNSIFSINRFGKYLVHDLVNAKNYFGVSLLICGLMPLITYAGYQLFNLIFFRSIAESSVFPQFMALVASFVVVVLCFPSKVYGSITERRAGTSWILLPASTFEKWLSMVVVTCLVLPICFGILFFGVDALMSVIFANYPSPVFNYVLNFRDVLSEISGESQILDMHLDITWMFVLSWCDSILAYLLGAIFFKKSKIAKTILALMAFGIIVSIFMGSMIQNGFSFGINSSMNIDEVNGFLDKINSFTYLYYSLFFVVLNVLIYLRLKTIKH